MLPVTVPGPAYFAAQLRGLRFHRFGAMLSALAPHKYQALPGQPPAPLACYRALVEHCGALFPVYDSDLEMEFELGDQATPDEMDEMLAALEANGIPVRLFGFYDDPDSLRDDQASPTEAVLYWYSNTEDEPLTRYESLADYRPADLERRAGERRCARDFAKAPRGRAWRAPWVGLCDLVDYIGHNTGYGILDLTPNDEVPNPPWHLDEIRNLAHHWQGAKPIYERLLKLRQYIDAQPARRLPHLIGLLQGDAALREKLSRELSNIIGEALQGDAEA